jgi:hypothetical protein
MKNLTFAVAVAMSLLTVTGETSFAQSVSSVTRFSAIAFGTVATDRNGVWTVNAQLLPGSSPLRSGILSIEANTPSAPGIAPGACQSVSGRGELTTKNGKAVISPIYFTLPMCNARFGNGVFTLDLLASRTVCGA